MDLTKTTHILALLVLLSWSVSSSMSDDYPRLLLGNRVNIQVIETRNVTSIQPIIDDIEYTMSCDYIYSDNLILWVDGASVIKKIQSVYTNVSYENRVKHDVIKTGLVQPDGLACDWIGKKIYWTDSEANHIEVSELDGRARTVLVWDQVDRPRAIAVDPLRRYMYWTNWGENPKIERAGMDGSERKVLVERDGIYWPNGLTIDYEENKVYWVDANYHYINRMNTDGSGREVVVSNGPFNAGDNTGNYESESDTLSGLLQHPFAITLSGNRIYWTDWATNSIHSSVKNGTGQTTVIKIDISLHDIHSYGPHRQKQAPNPCGSNNGGCSHLCLLSPTPPYFSCACPTGVLLKPDKKTCKDGPEHILLLARRPDLRVISLDTPDFSDIVLPVENIASSVAIDYDPVDDMVYWSSNGGKEKAIFRAKLDGTMEQQIISNGVEQCDGIAVDWVARNIYWSEADRHYIAVARLNGTSKKVIIEEGIVSPRAIVLDPSRGQMYWSDWGKPKIERASLDGSDRYVFVNSSVHWPNGLAIDYKKELLFWAEAYLDKIEVIGLNGSNRRVLLEEKLPHIFGFSFLDDYLYWTDWEKRKVERMLFYDRKSRHSMIEELPDLMGIKATDVNPIPATNPCVENNGGCSHLCLYTPIGVKCHCPDGQELLSDTKTCIEPEAFLLFTLSADGVHRISLETAPSASVEVSLKPDIDATLLDALVETETVFWTDSDHKVIYRANMNGTGVSQIVSTGVGTLEDIAIDWIGYNIYWTDSDKNKIEMAKLDGSSRKPVIVQDLNTPSSLAIDPTNGFLYWSEWGGRPQIRRAKMDGSEMTQLHGNGKVGRTTSLTIDFEHERLYWVDLDANEIVSSDMTGGDKRSIYADEDNKFFSIALYHEYIFWTKGTVIQRANKTDGSNRIQIQGHMPGPTISDMLVYHASRQTGVSACSYGNGGCQHICLTAPGGTSKCACPAQYKLKKDNVTCVAPNDFLLYTEEDVIQRIVFEHGQNNRQIPDAILPDAVLPIAGLDDAVSIAYDAVENYVLWIDDNGIHRAKMNNTKRQTLFHGNSSHISPHDLAVDQFNRMLYWTDSKKNSISAMNLNGDLIGDIIIGSVKLVSDGHSKKMMDVMPRQIAACPKKAQIFFSSTCPDHVSCREAILSSYVDGSNVIKLFATRIQKVSSLLVDQDRDRLYWSDKGMEDIVSSDLDGGNRQIFQSGVKKPYALTIYGSALYWISEESTSKLTPQWKIEAARKSEPHKEPQKIMGLSHEVRDLVGVTGTNRRKPETDYYRCALDNGGCSHICVGKEDGTVSCSCPLHLSMVNNFECGEAPTCAEERFSCESSKELCLPSSWRCDGDDDCPNKSDERHCPPCQLKNSFQCGTGRDGSAGGNADSVDVGKFMKALQNMHLSPPQCINMKRRCDGKRDCADNSDEINCSSACGEHQFQCKTGQCISILLKCNGHNDCEDNSDEECTPDLPAAVEAHSDRTMIIIIICCVFCVAVVVVIAAVTLRRKKSRNGVTVGGVYTKNDGGRFHFNFKITDVGHSESENQHPRSSEFGSGGRSTASVNVSLTADRSAQIVPSGMPNSRGHHLNISSPHQYFDSTPYTNAGAVIPHLPRPNIPGASSSTSSGHGQRHFQPTLNPPPSPATDRSGSKAAGDGHYSTDSQSTRAPRCYKCRVGHRPRRMHRSHAHVPVPHPTPCPSDSYDDCMSYSGTSVREFDSISWRSKSAAGAPSSPPPPYCYCCHHMYHPPFVGCNGSYHPYHPSSCRTPRHGYHTPTMPHDPHHHSSSSSSSTHYGQPDYPVMCCNRSSSHYHYMPNRKPMCSAMPQRPPPCYSYDANSDSDPFAPPPTPRSQYLSDYCCTHDEAEENHDEEAYFDVMGKEKFDTEPCDVANEKANKKPDMKLAGELKPRSAVGNDEDDKTNENQPLLINDSHDSPTNSAEIDFPILNPPPSPVADLS